jgi:hypothetical protein
MTEGNWYYSSADVQPWNDSRYHYRGQERFETALKDLFSQNKEIMRTIRTVQGGKYS